MAKKGQRRNAGAKVSTKSQAKKRSKLRRFNYSSKNAVKVSIPGWNPRKSLRENYARLGIAYDANSVVARPREATQSPEEQALPPSAGILTNRLTYIQNLPKPEPYEVRSMNVQEQYRLQNLIRAHGTDYAAMERDLQLNIMQETATKLQKRIELLFRIQSLQTGDMPLPSSSSTQIKMEDGIKSEQMSDDDDDLPDEDEDDEFEEMDSSEFQAMIKAIQTPAMIVAPGISYPKFREGTSLVRKALTIPGAAAGAQAAAKEIAKITAASTVAKPTSTTKTTLATKTATKTTSATKTAPLQKKSVDTPAAKPATVLKASSSAKSSSSSTKAVGIKPSITKKATIPVAPTPAPAPAVSKTTKMKTKTATPAASKTTADAKKPVDAKKPAAKPKRRL